MATIVEYIKSDMRDFAGQVSVIREEFGPTPECRRGALLNLPKEAATMKLKATIFIVGLILGTLLGMAIPRDKAGFVGFGGGTTRGHGASSSW